jgi:hypothetical protein
MVHCWQQQLQPNVRMLSLMVAQNQHMFAQQLCQNKRKVALFACRGGNAYW